MFICGDHRTGTPTRLQCESEVFSYNHYTFKADSIALSFMVADVKHTLILCAELFRSLWTYLYIIHLQLTLSFLSFVLFNFIFLKLNFIVLSCDYFLNKGCLGHITFHFYSASTKKGNN